MTVAGSCEASQSMAIYYGLFKKPERPAAFKRLLEIIHQNGDHMNAGALGMRVLFHVLSEYGQADLAYEMITRKDYPSYGNWIARGATSFGRISCRRKRMPIPGTTISLGMLAAGLFRRLQESFPIHIWRMRITVW